MTGAAFSAAWFRVRDLAPRLRPHVRVVRQPGRHAPAWLLHDAVAGNDFLINRPTWTLVGLMDGRRTVGEIWQAAATALRDDLPTQDAVVRLLTQLYQADLLSMDVSPELEELNARAAERQSRRRWAGLRNPLSLRFPLADPDRFLTRSAWIGHLVFSPAGLMVWLGLMVWTVVQAGLNWPELTANLTDRVLSGGNLAVLAITFPLTKLLHEMGHAYAVKRWGGAVHEVGVMFLVLMPAPYVDASAATAFPDRWPRFVVGAAGMMVELALAGIAMAVWLLAEPGLLRAFAFNVMLIATVSSLLFNGNPLLRFDAYFMLCDALGMPNLGTRANTHLRRVATRILGGQSEPADPVPPIDSVIYWIYGPSAFVYRTALVLVIAVFLAGRYQVLGVALALYSLVTGLVMPLWKAARGLFSSPAFDRCRPRAILAVLGVLTLLFGFVALLPFPRATVAQGVIWVPESAYLRSGQDGEVVALLVEPGSLVAAGQPIIELADPWLENRIAIQTASLAVLNYRLQAAAGDPVLTHSVEIERTLALENLAQSTERRNGLLLRAPVSGRLVLPQAHNLTGRLAARGQVLGYVLAEGKLPIRAVVPEAEADLVRDDLKGVAARLSRDQSLDLPGVSVVSLSPRLTRDLPALALSDAGGGTLPLDPTSTNGVVALGRVLTIDLVAAASIRPILLGERVHLRLSHSPAPLLPRFVRILRQLLLSHLGR